MAQYGCPIEPFGLLMRRLWTPFGPVWTNYRPQMALFGQYGHLWPSYGSLRARYGPIVTHQMALMTTLWPFMAANMDPYRAPIVPERSSCKVHGLAQLYCLNGDNMTTRSQM